MSQNKNPLSIADDESNTLVPIGDKQSSACIGVRPDLVATADGQRQRVKVIVGTEPTTFTLDLTPSQAQAVALSILEVVGDEGISED